MMSDALPGLRSGSILLSFFHENPSRKPVGNTSLLRGFSKVFSSPDQHPVQARNAATAGPGELRGVGFPLRSPGGLLQRPSSARSYSQAEKIVNASRKG